MAVSCNEAPVALPSVFNLPATETDVANYLKRFVPYLHGARDIGEPETLYLWDAAKRAGLTYRNYGEYVETITQADVKAINEQRAKKYPDTTPTVLAFPVKKTLEDHFAPGAKNFDLDIPDAMTTDSYRAASILSAQHTSSANRSLRWPCVSDKYRHNSPAQEGALSS